MTTEMMTGRWNEIRGDVLRKWGRLTSSDLDRAQGHLDRLVGLVQERYGYTSHQARQEVNRFLNQYGLSTGQMQEKAGGALATIQDSMKSYPWAFAAGAVVLVLLVVGFVIKPFNH